MISIQVGYPESWPCALNDLEFRNYDPALGRMNQIDPMAAKYASVNPYNYSFNDPVSLNDPSGAEPETGGGGMPGGYWYYVPYSPNNTHYSYIDMVTDLGGGEIFNGRAGMGSLDAYGGGMTDWRAETFGSTGTKAMRDAWAVEHGEMSRGAYADAYGESATLFVSFRDWYSGSGEYMDSEFLGFKLKLESGETFWSNVRHLGHTTLFESADAAAIDWALGYNDNSIVDGNEYGSSIYEVDRGGDLYYRYSKPRVGDSDGVNPSPAPKRSFTVAYIHSHGKYSGFANEFSDRDKEAFKNDHVFGYVAT